MYHLHPRSPAPVAFLNPPRGGRPPFPGETEPVLVRPAVSEERGSPSGGRMEQPGTGDQRPSGGHLMSAYRTRRDADGRRRTAPDEGGQSCGLPVGDHPP